MDMVNKRRSVLQTLKDEKELKELNEKLQHYYSDCKKLQALAGNFSLILEKITTLDYVENSRTGTSGSQC